MSFSPVMPSERLVSARAPRSALPLFLASRLTACLAACFLSVTVIGCAQPVDGDRAPSAGDTSSDDDDESDSDDDSTSPDDDSDTTGDSDTGDAGASPGFDLS